MLKGLHGFSSGAGLHFVDFRGPMLESYRLLRFAFAGVMAFSNLAGISQGMPATAGETLNGKRLELAEATRGHAVVLVAGFSREGGSGCGAWMKAIQADSSLVGVVAYQIAMLEGAPGFIRGAIKNGMRKGLTAAEQDRFLVLTQDGKLWQRYFDVSTDKDPYVVMIDAKGNIVWRGHGAAANLEPMLRVASGSH
jgi:hypothetical protein